MKLTPEQLKQARRAKTPQELETMAGELGISLTKENAHALYHSMHKTGALADEELDNVAGGCGSDEPEANLSLDIVSNRFG